MIMKAVYKTMGKIMINKNSKASLTNWVPLATGSLMAVSLMASHIASAAVSDYKWPYNHTTPVQFNVGDLERSYASWKSARITANNAGGNGRYRVMGGVDDGSTVSEGIAYGMILTSLFDDQTEFDGLWLFAKDHFDNQNLMHWHIGNPGELRGQGAATDGDVDMAIALVNACTKFKNSAWPASTHAIDYCADATTIINNIYNHEVDLPGSQPPTGLDGNLGYELMPGDQWYLQSNYPDGVVNHSYFPPAYFRVFGKFTGETQKWQRVIDRNYAMIDEVQAKSGNCSGLVPNWNKYNGDVQVVSWQPNNSGWWSYDAARFGWRIATDAMWYDSPDAEETASELGSFFASVGMNSIGGEYQMNGQRTGNGANNFFIGNAAAPIVAAKTLTAITCGDASPTIKTTPQQAYDRTLAGGITPSDYYGAYWRLANMLLMTGNFPNLYEVTGSGGTAPSVSMTSPADGATFPSGSSVALAANASDDGQVTQVEFFANGVSVGIDSTAPFALTVNNLSDGAHSIYADATDNDGLTASSTAISISLGSSPNMLPVARFTNTTSGLTVNVDGAGSSDSDGSIQNYAWDFGDGTAGTGVKASHTYATAGTYSVGLTVTDNDAGADTATSMVTVTGGSSGGNTCTYTVSNEWSTGFVAEITIANNGKQAINGWEVNWAYTDGSLKTSGWNANYTGNNPYTASAFNWNGQINPGQSLTFGFQGTKGQADSPTQVPVVSGAVCN